VLTPSYLLSPLSYFTETPTMVDFLFYFFINTKMDPYSLIISRIVTKQLPPRCTYPKAIFFTKSQKYKNFHNKKLYYFSPNILFSCYTLGTKTNYEQLNLEKKKEARRKIIICFLLFLHTRI
jgi:hypothetical protein